MKRALPLTVLLLLLQGCINYEQHTVLEEDGSGTMSIHYWIPESMFMWMQDGPVSFNEDSVRVQYSADGITVDRQRIEAHEADSTRHVWVDLSFDDITRISDCKGFEKYTYLWQREGDVFRFEQGVPGNVDSSSFDFLDKFTFTYAFEFPGAIRECNADTVDGNRAVWVIPVSEMNTDLRMTAIIEATSGRSVYWILGVLAVVVILIIITYVVRKKSTRRVED